MSGMYPDDQLLEIFGEQVMYPGLHPETHKFTDGDFSNPLIKPSHIPASTFNLIIDNIENLVRAMGQTPSNTDPEQLKKAIQNSLAPVSHASNDTKYGPASPSKYGHAKASGTSPKMNGEAAVGAEEATFARGDHVHPTDTTRAPLASPAFTGTPTTPTPASSAQNTQIANTSWVFDNFAPRSVAEYHDLGYEPSAAELVRLRYLPLRYQIIEIALYQELYAKKYVGDDENDTADWWYKCDQVGNRTITGQYMRVEDARGLFRCGAGANAAKFASEGMPYKGKNAGEFSTDMGRKFTGTAAFGLTAGLILPSATPTGIFQRGSTFPSERPGGSISGQSFALNVDITNVWGAEHTGDYFKSASISAYPCISY